MLHHTQLVEKTWKVSRTVFLLGYVATLDDDENAWTSVQGLRACVRAAWLQMARRW